MKTVADGARARADGRTNGMVWASTNTLREFFCHLGENTVPGVAARTLQDTMVSIMRFAISDPLLSILRARCRRRGRVTCPIEGEKEAFLIYPGLGPACYLTVDGRVLVDARDWDGSPIREASDEQGISAIVVGARSTGVRELLDLLPSAPANACTCADCRGARYVDGIVCSNCSGLGWTVPTGIALLSLSESVRSYVSQLGSDVEQLVNKEIVTFSRCGSAFARVCHGPYTERVIIVARVDPSSVSLEEGFTRDVSRGEWMLVPFEDRTRDLEITVRSTDDFERAKPLIRRAHEGS